MYQNKVLNHMNTKFPKFFFVRELKKSIHLSHKRKLWIEEPKLKNSERRHAGGLRKDKKSKSTKVQNGMGMRNK